MKPSLNYKALMCVAIVAGIAVLASLHYCGKSPSGTPPKSLVEPEFPASGHWTSNDIARLMPPPDEYVRARMARKLTASMAALAEHAIDLESKASALKGPIDLKVETVIDGKRMPHEEAIRIIRIYLRSTDKEDIYAAVGALVHCSAKVVDEDIIQRLLALYEKTPSHLLPNPPTLSSEEARYDMDLKIMILWVMDTCGGRHRDAFLSKAAKDPNPSIRWNAEKLVRGEPIKVRN
ncbi:MAG: hypothetical protein WC740_14635 [Verrucomicrobiia bacterium]